MAQNFVADANQNATKEECEAKLKESEGKIQPIFVKLYQSGHEILRHCKIFELTGIKN